MKIYLLFILLGLIYSQVLHYIPLYGKVTGGGGDYYYLDTITLKDNSKVYIEVVFYDYWDRVFNLMYKKSSTNDRSDFTTNMISVPYDSKSWSSFSYYSWDYKYTYTYTVYSDITRRYILFTTNKPTNYEITIYHRSSSYYWILVTKLAEAIRESKSRHLGRFAYRRIFGNRLFQQQV